MENDVRSEAIASYQSINHLWLKFHYKMLKSCVIISTFFELLFFIYIKLLDKIEGSTFLYWLNYIVVPAIIGIVLIFFAHRTMNNHSLNIRKKEYHMSFYGVLLAFDLSFMHSSYIPILFVNVIPILMCVIYESKRLTSLVAVCGLFIEVICAFTRHWSSVKVITYEYIIDLILVLILTCVVWMISFSIIRFAKMKKERIINQDVERYDLRQRINMDELTQVGNRKAIRKHLLDLDQHPDMEYFIAMLDIDKFKMINDEHGHLYGDHVLKCLGGCLSNMGSNAYGYRYGGDEFCVIFHESNEAVVKQELRWLQKDFHKMLRLKYPDSEIEFSSGVGKNFDNIKAIDVMAKADEALYRAKKQLDNRICFIHNDDF